MKKILMSLAALAIVSVILIGSANAQGVSQAVMESNIINSGNSNLQYSINEDISCDDQSNEVEEAQSDQADNNVPLLIATGI